jgi:hypothetical protein
VSFWLCSAEAAINCVAAAAGIDWAAGTFCPGNAIALHAKKTGQLDAEDAEISQKKLPKNTFLGFFRPFA